MWNLSSFWNLPLAFLKHQMLLLTSNFKCLCKYVAILTIRFLQILNAFAYRSLSSHICVASSSFVVQVNKRSFVFSNSSSIVCSRRFRAVTSDSHWNCFFNYFLNDIKIFSNRNENETKKFPKILMKKEKNLHLIWPTSCTFFSFSSNRIVRCCNSSLVFSKSCCTCVIFFSVSRNSSSSFKKKRSGSLFYSNIFEKYS